MAASMKNPMAEAPRALPVVEREKRQQVLRGAHDVFLKCGFEGASMEQIAKAAGVSKGTLYVYFPSKEDLFIALVSQEKEHLAENLLKLDGVTGDLVAGLTEVLVEHLKRLCAPGHVALIRLVIGAAGAFPEIGVRFYESGPCRGRENVADFLKAQSAAGRLAVDDPMMAAGHFLDLISGNLLRRMLFCATSVPDEDEIRRDVASGLKVFMAAYGVK